SPSTACMTLPCPSGYETETSFISSLSGTTASVMDVPPPEQQVIDEPNDSVGEDANHPHHEDTGETPSWLGVSLGELQHIANPVLRVHQLCENDVRPSNRVHHPEAVKYLRQGRGDEHGEDGLPPAGAEREGGVDELLRDCADGVHDDGEQ